MRTTTLMLSLALSLSANACPPGTAPRQGVGWQGCAPVPGTAGSGQPSSAPKSRWATRWGAVAVDMAINGTGVSAVSGMTRERQASSSALQACKRKGGTQCEVRLTYYDQCVAVVTGDRGFTTNSAATVEEATQIGIEKCNRQGDTNCRLHFSDCSLPEKI